MQRTHFQPAFYAKFQVGKLTPDQQDEMLANGWFRNDLSVYASSVKFMGDDWRSCLMLRVPLENFTWKKRLRKLIRRNGELFEVQVRPFQQTAEKEKLWQHFKSQVHGWVAIPELDKHLLKHASPKDFCTWELCILKDEKLVAFSIFDRGRTSVASLEAAYDPAWSRFSLGIYTMLMEIDFAMREGMAFYYPGFLPREVPMFEYKLRPGGLEFFRLKEKKWVPWEQHDEKDWLLEQVLAQFERIKASLRRENVITKTGFAFYPSIPSAKPSPFHSNILLVVKNPEEPQKNSCLISWDPMSGEYQLFSAFPTYGLAYRHEHWAEDAARLLDVSMNKFIGKFSDPASLAAEVLKLIGRR